MFKKFLNFLKAHKSIKINNILNSLRSSLYLWPISWVHWINSKQFTYRLNLHFDTIFFCRLDEEKFQLINVSDSIVLHADIILRFIAQCDFIMFFRFFCCFVFLSLCRSLEHDFAWSGKLLGESIDGSRDERGYKTEPKMWIDASLH